MIDELRLFRGQDYIVNDYVTIRQPTISEICTYGEQKYYEMVSSLCATPSDLKVQLLDDFKTDYEEISEFDLFCIFSHSFTLNDTSILFGDLDFQQFVVAENQQNGEITIQNVSGNTIIDNAAYILLTTYLRSIHGFEKHVDKAANAYTKQSLIDSERRYRMRHKNDKYKSMLVPLISAMVNCEQFKYNHTTVWDLPIYVFMDSVRRIQKLKNYNQVMQGAYAGTIDLSTISEEGLNWMGSLSSR